MEAWICSAAPATVRTWAEVASASAATSVALRLVPCAVVARLPAAARMSSAARESWRSACPTPCSKRSASSRSVRWRERSFSAFSSSAVMRSVTSMTKPSQMISPLLPVRGVAWVRSQTVRPSSGRMTRICTLHGTPSRAERSSASR